MPKYIEVKGDVIEFPDNMADADIEKAIKKNMLSVAPKPEIDDPGFLQSALIGAGRSTDRLIKGAQQAYYSVKGDKKALADLKAQAEADDAAYKPLQEMRPFATGIGEAVPSMAVPFGASATVLSTAGKMALAGGIPSALEYGTLGERAERGLYGAAGGAALPLLGAVGKSAKSFVEPLYTAGREQIVGRTLNRVAGDDAANVIAKLKDAKPLVPGSLPTAAEVAENGGISALQRATGQAFPSDFSRRGMEQSSARVGALRNIAGDDVAIDTAKALRNDATKDVYSQAKSATYFADDKLNDLLERPIVKKALARAEEIAKNDGRTFSFQTSTSAPFSGVGGRASQSSTNVSGQSLQDLKMAIDAMLKDPTSGIAGVEADQAKKLRGQIISWMESANPEFGAARKQFAQMSKPINQMQVGQALLEKLQPALADYGALGAETGATYARTLRNADQFVKNATDFKGAKSLADVMGVDNMGTLNSIAQDLARKSNAENLGRGVGSDTFQKLSMQNIAEQSGMPRLVGGLLDAPGVSRATKWVYRDSDEQAQKVIADAMLNPQKAAELMQAAKSGLLDDSPKLKKLLLQSGLRAGGLLTLSAVPKE